MSLFLIMHLVQIYLSSSSQYSVSLLPGCSSHRFYCIFYVRLDTIKELFIGLKDMPWACFKAISFISYRSMKIGSTSIGVELWWFSLLGRTGVNSLEIWLLRADECIEFIFWVSEMKLVYWLFLPKLGYSTIFFWTADYTC